VPGAGAEYAGVSSPASHRRAAASMRPAGQGPSKAVSCASLPWVAHRPRRDVGCVPLFSSSSFLVCPCLFFLLSWFCPFLLVCPVLWPCRCQFPFYPFPSRSLYPSLPFPVFPFPSRSRFPFYSPFLWVRGGSGSRSLRRTVRRCRARGWLRRRGTLHHLVSPRLSLWMRSWRRGCSPHHRSIPTFRKSGTRSLVDRLFLSSFGTAAS